jgi:hypothetical protein
VEPIPLDQQGKSWDGGNGMEVGVMMLTFENQRAIICLNRFPGGVMVFRYSSSSSLVFLRFAVLGPTLTTTDGLFESGERFTGIPRLEFSDEGCVAASDEQGKLYSDTIKSVENGWNTWGPFKGPSALFNFTARYRLWYPATTGWPVTGWPGLPEAAGITPSLWRLDLTTKRELSINSLQLWTAASNTDVKLSLVYGHSLSDVKGTLVPVSSKNTTEVNISLSNQGWFYLVSPNTSATQMFFILGNHSGVQLQLRSDGFITCVAAGLGPQMAAGTRLSYQMLSFGIGMLADLTQIEQVRALQMYLVNPTVQEPNVTSRVGYRPSYAKRINAAAPLLEYNTGGTNDQTQVEIMLPRPAAVPQIGVVVPLRVCGLVRRWSVGLFQRSGYVMDSYYNGTGENRFTALGLDVDACAYAPLYVDRVALTSVVVGHPVVIAGGNNASLWTEVFIEVVKISDEGNHSWVVTANNPTTTDLLVTLLPLWEMQGFPIPQAGVRVLIPAMEELTVARSGGSDERISVT